MNAIQSQILLKLNEGKIMTQRSLAKEIGVSVGIINREYREMVHSGFITEEGLLKDAAKELLQRNAPKQAIILAAGYGQRMVPINMDTPKGILTVYGETLIERIIRQLHEVGIHRIYVVVGYMKEAYEFLMDQYNVELIVNNQYAQKNNLHSLLKAIPFLECGYIIPCDIWSRINPFSKYECNSWYMMSDLLDETAELRVNKQFRIVDKEKNQKGNQSIGIAYLNPEDVKRVRQRLIVMGRERCYDNSFWEESIIDRKSYGIAAKLIRHEDVYEINTYENLRDIDEDSENLKTEIIETIAGALHTDVSHVKNIKVLKKGMTNRSFLFECLRERYIMRIPGEGTDKLIDRKKEAAVYRALAGKNICDDVVYINDENGYKITKYMEDSRVCDADNANDLKVCMELLRRFHQTNIQVDHCFDMYAQLEYYERLWDGKESVYKDYQMTKQNVLSLRDFVSANAKKYTLTHIDAVPDNFLLQKDSDGSLNVRLIDWEYAGMQDPDLDIAMFSIYALYNRAQIDRLISIYYEDQVDRSVQYKIYAYIATAGLLWSNWCEYKRLLGIDFGEYSLKQYRYAKDFYRIVKNEFLDSMNGEQA